jgi:hypothetical protein
MATLHPDGSVTLTPGEVVHLLGYLTAAERLRDDPPLAAAPLFELAGFLGSALDADEADR